MSNYVTVFMACPIPRPQAFGSVSVSVHIYATHIQGKYLERIAIHIHIDNLDLELFIIKLKRKIET